MSVKFVTIIFAVVCLGSVLGLKCYGPNNNKVSCDEATAQATVLGMQQYYNVSTAYTHNSFMCITLNQTYNNGGSLFLSGCTFANTTCSAPLKQGLTVQSGKCKHCNNKDFCNGSTSTNVSAMIFTIVLGVFAKSLMN